MPSRIVREEILTSGRVDRLGWQQEVFYRRLLSKVDDHGLYDARPSILRCTLFPLRVDKVSEEDCSNWLAACESAGLLVTYEVGGKPYLKVLDTRWQTRSEPKYPLPDGGRGEQRTTVNDCEQPLTPVPVVVVVDDVVDVVDEEPVRAVARHAPKPSAVNVSGTRLDPLWTLPPDWAAWAQEERPEWTVADVERVGLSFRDHWHSVAGAKARKADWLATWRNWVRNERRNYRTRPDQAPDRREKQAQNIDILTGKANGRIERTIVAERVDRAPVLSLPGGLREPATDDVEGRGPDRGPSTVGRGTGTV